MQPNHGQGDYRDEEERYYRLAEQESTRYLLRDPRLAALLSGLVMGLGQLFNGQYKRAFTFFGGEVAVFLYLWDYSYGLAVSQTLTGLTAPWAYRGFLWLLSFGGLGLWLYNVRDAYRMAEFCQFIFDRAFPMLDDEESEIVARHLTINRGGLSFQRGVSRKAVFLGGGILLYSGALLALGAFYLGRRDRAPASEASDALVVPSRPRPLNSDPNDPKARLRAGEAAYEAGDLGLAERELEALLALEPPPRLRYEAMVDLGKVASANGNEQKASDLLMKAVALSKQLAAQQAPSKESPLGRAGEALEKGHPAEAEKLLAPLAQDPQSWFVLGKTAAARGEWDRARELLSGYCSRPAADAGAWLELARVELKQGRRQDCIAHAERYLKLRPGDTDGVLLKAAAVEAQKGPRAAYGAIEEALASHPDDPRLLEEAMQLAEGAGNMDQALQAARVLLKQQPENEKALAIMEAAAPSVRPPQKRREPPVRNDAAQPPEREAPVPREVSAGPAAPADVSVEKYSDYLREAELAYSRGDKQRALENYERVLQVRPDHQRSLYQKGVLLQQRKDRQGAILAFGAAVRVRPDDVASLGELGKLFMETEQPGRAEEAFKKVIVSEPRNLAARYALAELMERKDDPAGAEEQYKAILRHYPELTPAYEYLGNLYYRQQKYEEALAQFRKMMALAGSDPMVRFKMGLICYKTNRATEALEHFRAVRGQIDRNHRLYAQVERYVARLEHRGTSARADAQVDGGEP
ncbi:MAG: tetratricopeptide repeat protein [Candidatus Wallbacteria bacterium]|nr:tetratricopeptide repeat protein [Candidatus Wallbacteria bacterium]